jgi:hypothetical protein
MKKVNASVLLAAASLLGWAGVAAAGPVVTIDNTTEVESDNGTNGPTTGFFGGGDYWGSNIGSPVYNTPSATISFVGNTVDIEFQTGFDFANGQDTTYKSQYGVTVYGADIFLKSGGGATLPGTAGSSFFNYGISLGFDAADGGNVTAGLYSIAAGATAGVQYQTSTGIWGTRNSFDYGGAYATAGACTATVAACAASSPSPTVLLAGNNGNVLQSGINVTTSTGVGTLTVALTGTTTAGLDELESIFSNFDIFWGTGDCSNAPIWGNVAGLTRVPEPSSLALLATAAIGFRIMRRRKRKAPAVG